MNELLSFMSGTFTQKLSKEDQFFIVQNFAVYGGIVKLSMPFTRGVQKVRGPTMKEHR